MNDRDEYVMDRLLATQDEADWLAARGYEPEHPSTEHMIRWHGDQRAAAESAALEGWAEKAVVRDGWRTADPQPADRRIELHATYIAYVFEDLEHLRAQLAAIGFDSITLEDAP